MTETKEGIAHEFGERIGADTADISEESQSKEPRIFSTAGDTYENVKDIYSAVEIPIYPRDERKMVRRIINRYLGFTEEEGALGK